MKYWRVIDDYNEKILPEKFYTEQQSADFMNFKISYKQAHNENYAYDIDFLEDGTTYKEYMDMRESEENMNDLVIVKKATVEAFGFTEKNETPEHAIYRAKTYYKKDLDTYKSHLINYPDMAEYWRSRIEATEKTLEAGFEVVTFEEFLTLQKKHLCNGELTEITKEDFEEHLNMLPPLKWCNRHNVEMFCMSEMYTGTYTTQYAYSLVTGKYYCAMVDVTDSETWIDKILDKAA